ncbi:MAG: efflux RND transporter permease subunit [Deltaproteobacteria bacterium]|nr:MAG: efflux RND transporter permease subunit [Deltaproteobacteria bacterium]
MKLADVSIKRPVLATVMVGALVVFGMSSYPNIGVDLFPNVEFPFAAVTAIYPGADPETIESKVIEKLEEHIGSVSGIDVMMATAQENVGTVIIQFVLERNADQAVQDVRDKVALALNELPADLDPPIVQKFDVGAAPILTLAVGGKLSPRELTALADDVVKAKIQTVYGVGGVELVGKSEREIHVWLDPAALERYMLSASDVMQALAMQNVEIPGGRLNAPGVEWSVKTRGQVRTAHELADIVITSAAGAPIRVRDVARVEDGQEETRSVATLNGESAIALVVRKTSGANTVEVAERVREAVHELQPRLPQGVTISVPLDNSTFIEASIESVKFDLMFGGLLAIIIILFFLHDWRATLVSALALPASVVGTFAFINAMGFTFNNMTMLALTLSIGMLIDDAIVVIENIHRHLEMGKPPKQAAREATAEIGLAVMATTGAIIAVFLPVAIMKGIVGRFFLQFGLTVVFAVSVSLLVAFTITPAYAARLLKSEHSKKRKLFIARWIEAFLGAIDRFYRATLAVALKHPVLTMVVATGVFMGSMSLAANIKGEFLPPDDRGEFNVRIELPQGTDIDTTRSYFAEVTEQLRAVPGVESTLATIGAGAQGEVQSGLIQVNTLEKRKRAFTQVDAMAFVRGMLAARTDAVISVEKVDAFGGGGIAKQSEIQYSIRGPNLSELEAAAAKLIGAMKDAGGYVDLDTSFRGGKPEVQISIDRNRAADLGVPVALLASTIRTYFAGEKATELLTSDGRWDVRVRLDAEHRADPAGILGLTVRSTTSGALIPMSQLVAIQEGDGPGKITRQDRQRQVLVYANLQGKPLAEAMEEVEQLAAKVVPAGLDRSFAGQAKVMRESFGYMAQALVLAIILVYLILAAQFESFLHPLTIMFSLPFAVTGAFGALIIADMTLNIFTFIGFIMLMGLVTKNAILLVDYTNTLRERGMSRREALLEAGPVRLRPILMTTAAMIFGMIPVAISQEVGAEQRAPMAVAVIGGLISSTVLTLVVVPVVYDLFDRVKDFVTRRRHKTVPAMNEA